MSYLAIQSRREERAALSNPKGGPVPTAGVIFIKDVAERILPYLSLPERSRFRQINKISRDLYSTFFQKVNSLTSSPFYRKQLLPKQSWLTIRDSIDLANITAEAENDTPSRIYLSSNQPVVVGQPQRITPQEQLKRLQLPNKDDLLVASPLSPDTANLVAEFATEMGDRALLTNWYTALERCGLLPETVPPLPDDIGTILDEFKQRCLTPLLMFIPGGAINELEDTMETYWEAQDPREKNPQFHIHMSVRQAQGDIRVAPHWVVITRYVIAESRNKSYAEQQALIKDLKLQCTPPSFYSTFAAILLHKVATGESLYEGCNERNGNVCTYTRLEETTRGKHLIIGDSAPSGGFVGSSNCNEEEIGIVAMWKP